MDTKKITFVYGTKDIDELLTIAAIGAIDHAFRTNNLQDEKQPETSLTQTTKG